MTHDEGFQTQTRHPSPSISIYLAYFSFLQQAHHFKSLTINKYKYATYGTRIYIVW
jgi:hypothetical protein